MSSILLLYYNVWQLIADVQLAIEILSLEQKKQVMKTDSSIPKAILDNPLCFPALLYKSFQTPAVEQDYSTTVNSGSREEPHTMIEGIVNLLASTNSHY